MGCSCFFNGPKANGDVNNLSKATIPEKFIEYIHGSERSRRDTSCSLKVLSSLVA